MIRIQLEDFDVGSELKSLVSGHSDIGGVCSFVGLVRDFSGNDDGKITAMTLEHYPGMTKKQLEKIESAARQRWDLIETLIIHRIGRLEPAEQIVLVAVGAAHREAAFAGAEFIMDFLKTEAPFWKKEEGTGGAKWVQAKQADAAKTKIWQKK